MTNKVDIGNFMGVLGATEQTPDGIRFPGQFMPSGNPVTAQGVTKAQLMSDRGMAEGWYEAVRGAYEREENQRNHESSTRDTPELTIRGEDGPPAEPQRSEAPAPVHTKSVEEELQTRYAFWRERLERAEADKAIAVKDCAEASKQLLKIEAALDAIRDV